MTWRDWQYFWDHADHFYFQWPGVLLLLVIIPAFWIVYLNYRRSQWQRFARFSYAGFVEHLRLNPSPWKRLWMPVAVSVLMALLVASAARPMLVGRFPVRTVNMMVVLDISLSMMAEDIRPNRLAAATDAAARFIESLPPDVRVGLELFAGDNYIVSPPTKNHDQIIPYLETLSREHLQMRTEIGDALKTAIGSLTTSLEPEAPPEQTGDSQPKPQQVIVLISDGDSRTGYPWQLAATQAKEQNISIFTVGIGSSQDTFITYQGQRLPVTFNENTLRQIARISGGEYFRVFNENDFQTVYEQVRERAVVFDEKEESLGFLFSALALFWLLFALVLQAVWVKKL